MKATLLLEALRLPRTLDNTHYAPLDYISHNFVNIRDFYFFARQYTLNILYFQIIEKKIDFLKILHGLPLNAIVKNTRGALCLTLIKVDFENVGIVRVATYCLI